MRVKLKILKSNDPGMKGKVFAFDEPDKFIFGRAPDCHCRIPNDSFVSRHHFLLEIDPPAVRLYDLASRNGTCVYTRKFEGRVASDRPGQGNGGVDLSSGDRIRVGDTIFEVSISEPVSCLLCDVELDEPAAKAALPVGNKVICRACIAKKKQEVAEAKRQAAAPKGSPAPKILCSRCGRGVSGEVGELQKGDYICVSCRSLSGVAPAALLANRLAKRAAESWESFGGKEPEKPREAEILQYKIGKELGRGGMGVVYLAQHIKTLEQVAIKIMLPKMASNERSRGVFEREMGAASALSHKNIIRFIGRGYSGNIYYFVLEYAPGGSLEDLLATRDGRLAPKEAGPIMAEALAGLACAHAAGFVHRDLKPSNILLGGSVAERIAKIGDFGLAKSFEKAGLSGMTQVGRCRGSLNFMSREQVTNYKFVKPVSDVFAMGATLYYLLTGKPVYDLQGAKEPFSVILEGGIVPVEQRLPEIPRGLAKVVGQSIAVDAKNRYQTAAEMREALLRAL